MHALNFFAKFAAVLIQQTLFHGNVLPHLGDFIASGQLVVLEVGRCRRFSTFLNRTILQSAYHLVLVNMLQISEHQHLLLDTLLQLPDIEIVSSVLTLDYFVGEDEEEVVRVADLGC